jgi:outer membrane immunogenic protein
MYRSNGFWSLLFAGVLSVGSACGQEIYRSEASVQYFGTFVSSTWNGGVQQTATDSGGVLANYRFFFNDYGGIELNYGWAPGTQNYLYFRGPVGVRADSDEATAAYVFQYPRHRVKPFGLLGTGALIFDPINAPGPETVQARAAFVYGGGLDVGFTDRVFLRAQYRGLVYDTPDFNAFFLGPDRVTHRAEPSIGFGIRF